MTYVSKDDVSLAFPAVAHFFLPILRREPYLTINFIRSCLMQGHAQLWVMVDGEATGVIVTEVLEFDGNRMGRVWMASGNGLRNGVEHYQKTIEPWFLGNGCNFIEIRGRKGWLKALSGYEEVHTVMRKAI